MNVLMLSPGYPDEMNWFTEGLARVGARVFGVGEGPLELLNQRCRAALTAYFGSPISLFDETPALAAIIGEVRSKGVSIDRVECLWEPLMILAARLREALAVPGMTVAETLPFRDKELMKQVLDGAGIRTPHHYSCASLEERRNAAERIGFPLIVKPIAGAGSADTYRVGDQQELDDVLARTAHVGQVSVEEFIEGEEYTFDTICSAGEILFHNVSWYRPHPLIGRNVQWISPQTVTLKDPDRADLRPGVEMGREVLKALGHRTGFTHMEWFLTERGEAVFGEIACRPPGARTVDLMNHASDLDLFTGWAEAVCHGRFSQPIERRYNSAIIFKRAHGEGRIACIEGLESFLSRFGSHVSEVALLPVGAMRRNWKATLLSDGHLIVRHPDLPTCMELADRVGTEIQLFAGL